MKYKNKLPDHLRPTKSKKNNSVKSGVISVNRWSDFEDVKPSLVADRITVGTLKKWLIEFKETNGVIIRTASGSCKVSDLQKLSGWNNDSCTIEELVNVLNLEQTVNDYINANPFTTVVEPVEYYSEVSKNE